MIEDETMDEELESLKGFENLEVPDGYTDRQWALFVGGRARQAYLAESMFVVPQKKAILKTCQILDEIVKEGSYDINKIDDFLYYFAQSFRYTIESFCDEDEDEDAEEENIQ